MSSRLFAAILGVLASPAAALQLDLFRTPADHVIPWPDIEHQTPGRMVLGDLLPDLRTDAVLLDGPTPVVVSAAGIYQAVFALGVSANDLALVPRGGGGQDLVLVNSTGLLRLSHSNGTTFTTTTLATGVWLDATRVVASGDGTFLVGISSSGSVLFFDLGSGVTSSYSASLSVLDLVAIRWGSAPAAAILHTGGFRVAFQAGGTTSSIPLPVQSGVTGLVREGSLERCLLVFKSGGQEYMGVLDNSYVESPTPLANLGHFAVSLADVDADGADDLLLTNHASYTATLFYNQHAGNPAQTFAAGTNSSESIPLLSGSTPPASWSAWPMLGDLTQDGDADVFAWVADSDELVLFENRAVALEDDGVQVENAFYAFDENEEHSGVLIWHASAPEEPTFEPTHVELTILKLLNTSYLYSSPAPVPVVVERETFALDSNGEVWTDSFLDEEELLTAFAYWSELRLVRLENEVLVAAGPSDVRGFTLHEVVAGMMSVTDEVRIMLTSLGDVDPHLMSAQEIEDRLSGPPGQGPSKPPPTVFPPTP